ncbi:MAG: hypothetical protein RR379_12155, partial [Clostridia bacterium]
PAGLEIASVHSYAENNTVTYKNAETSELQMSFSELGSNAETNLDTEGAAVRAAMVHDFPAFIAVKEKGISIYWYGCQKHILVE